MSSVAHILEEVLERLSALEATTSALDAKVQTLIMSGVSKGAKNALRRQCYRERQAALNKDKLILPEFPVLDRKDTRLSRFLDEWVQQGLLFGSKDDPEGFLRWLVYTWNNAYVKKCITYSGSSFRVWNGHCRHALGPGDLMHYYRKRVKMVPFLRNEAERQDFQIRPWWNWGAYVLMPVVREMQESELWETFSERFRTTVQLLGGGPACLEAPSGTSWDFNNELQDVNITMRHFAPMWARALSACLQGLRSSTEPPRASPPSHPALQVEPRQTP